MRVYISTHVVFEETYYPTCLQINLGLTLMSHLILLHLLIFSLNCMHMIILIQGNMLLIHTLMVIMLLLRTYSLMIKVPLTSKAKNRMLRNRLIVMICTVALKLQLHILDLLVAVQNTLHLQVQSIRIIK